jgi:PadR family transcriptional regulator AphA
VSLRYSLLGLLAARARTGYDLTKAFDASLLNVWPASHSQIYPELARLADEGLIRQTETGPRGKRVYEITAEGLDAVRAWLRTPPERWSRNPSFLRVFFLWLIEVDGAIDFLQAEATAHEEKLREYEAAAREPVADDPSGWAFRLALEWGIRYERGILEWNAWARRQVASRGRPAGRSSDRAPALDPAG